MVGNLFCAQAIDVRSRDPYYGAVVMDAASGTVLAEDHASAIGYPASMVKLANLFIVLDDLRDGKLRLDEPVEISREVEQIGGRQVWLKTGEVFPLEELIYATMIHSANDAATALAIRTSGSKAAHAARMTAKARKLGLTRTVFYNVHGLPPGAGQQADVTTALEMAQIARALITEHPEVLRYTSIPSRDFREGNPVRLTSSNKLLGTVDGCDGLKTGYFRAGGFSITATAKRNGRRVIAVILGCKDKTVRDAKAAEWIDTGFAKLPPAPVAAPVPPPDPSVTVAEPPADENPPEPAAKDEVHPSKKADWLMPVVVGLPVLIALLIALPLARRSRRT